MTAPAIEPAATPGHAARVLAKLLADAYRDHEIRTGETVHQIAQRTGIPHQRFYEVINRAEDPDYDPGQRKLEKLAGAIGLRWTLEPAR